MEYTTPPVEMEVLPAWRLGMGRYRTAVLCGIKGDDPVIGVVLDRKGKVLCQIQSYTDPNGCVYVNICDKIVETRCPD